MTQPVGAPPVVQPEEPNSPAGAKAGASQLGGSLGLGPVGDLIGGDWPIQAADTIERFIVGVRRKTTGPVIVASRAFVYGIIGATFGLAAFALVIVASVRALNILLPVWAVDLIVGGVLSLGGVLCLRRAHQVSPEQV